MNTKPRVLLVDDNVGMLETLSDIISTSGIDVDTAPDGARALALMEKNAYDIAVFDIVLPDIDGVDLVRRTQPRYPNTKFVIITAYTNSELTDRARAEPVSEILFKPIEPSRLIQVLRRLASGA